MCPEVCFHGNSKSGGTGNEGSLTCQGVTCFPWKLVFHPKTIATQLSPVPSPRWKQWKPSWWQCPSNWNGIPGCVLTLAFSTLHPEQHLNVVSVSFCLLRATTSPGWDPPGGDLTMTGLRRRPGALNHTNYIGGFAFVFLLSNRVKRHSRFWSGGLAKGHFPHGMWTSLTQLKLQQAALNFSNKHVSCKTLAVNKL